MRFVTVLDLNSTFNGRNKSIKTTDLKKRGYVAVSDEKRPEICEI